MELKAIYESEVLDFKALCKQGYFRREKVLLLMECNVMWDLEFRVIVEQEWMELCYCLAVAILSLMSEW